MYVTDPVADFLTRIRNAGRARHATCTAPKSNLKAEIARVLQEQGYIEEYWIEEAKPYDLIHVRLKYFDEKHVIDGLVRESTPGRRRYFGVADLPKVLDGLGIAVMSTSRGVMTDKQAAAEKVGGEFLCSVW